MPAPLRPRRSALYMPGSNPRALEKARDLPCDVIVMDLEDAVAPDAKAASRETVAAALRAGGYGGRELVLRVNGLDTAWGHDDLAFAAGQPVHAVLLPKVESADAVRRAEAVLAVHGAPDGLALWCMMETPRGVLEAAGIAGATPRLAGLVMGTSDLAKDLHCLHTPDRLPFVTALGLCLLAARAHGLAILDGVYLDLADDDGFAASCRQGVQFGFDGKTLIHPKTIAAANAAFAPSEEALAWARRITAAHAAAEAEGKGVLLVDGKLVEALHVAEAERLVALAGRIEALHGDGR
ncbi:CoA ester lyase [Thalassobaculum sp.]|uniref:HpcH/HpaI aldolase/citrate lyase family protein n=1 Tax=Thalassobaculum sp. TaxID=2022740 RepID=UPI0032F02B50